MDIFLEVVKVFGVPAILVVVIPLVMKRIFDKKDKRQDDLKDLKEFKESQEKLNKKILDSLERIEASSNLSSETQQALLRDGIIRMYNHYSKRKQMPIYARESFDKINTLYKKHGGNGTVEPLANKLYDLPTSTCEMEDDDY